jgi:hypothetical protein
MPDSPLYVEHGYIGAITATIPWKDLWNAESSIEIQKISLVVSPKKRVHGIFSL